MLNVAMGGTAESEASDVAVKPAGDPSGINAVMTATPAAWRRKTRLKASMPSTGTSCPSADAG